MQPNFLRSVLREACYPSNTSGRKRVPPPTHRGAFQNQTFQNQTESLACAPYPFTLILENVSTARPEVGRPIEVAGRNVVKMSALFTSGDNAFDSLLLDSTR
jgi:hypothetical protein